MAVDLKVITSSLSSEKHISRLCQPAASALNGQRAVDFELTLRGRKR